MKKIQLVTDYIERKEVEINKYNINHGADKSVLINGINLTNFDN